MATIKIKVAKTETSDGYDVLIGKGLIKRSGEIIKEHLSAQCQGKGFLILIGENSAQNYLDDVESSLRKSGYNDIKSIVIGEGKLTHITDRIPIVIGGNRFHLLLHTIKEYVYIPTTFLGMANNAVMGHPMVVISDINLLNTLDYKYFMSGYSEVAKHAIMQDPDFFDWLETHGRSIFDGDENARVYSIKQSCRIKAKFMSDEKTKVLLGLGHLYGDAIQKTSNNTLLHGEFISIGIVAAFKLAHKIKLCDVEEYKKVRRHLKSMSLPVDLHGENWDIDTLVNALDLTVPVILPKKIGEMTVFDGEIPQKTLRTVANEIIEKGN